jgi:hypothetical protein
VEKENRIHSRTEVECPVTMITPNVPVPAITQDISLSGAAIRFAEPPPLVASPVRFVFKPKIGHFPFLKSRQELMWQCSTIITPFRTSEPNVFPPQRFLILGSASPQTRQTFFVGLIKVALHLAHLRG